MDIEFDTLVEEKAKLPVDGIDSDPVIALTAFEEVWHFKASRRARRMDIIGDYAGNELFVIDGDSLLQLVLDDPLIALALPKETSYQILHAFHSLERLLQNFLRRGAIFEIVFWDDAIHLTVKPGMDDFMFASRHLARRMLIRHLEHLNIPVHHFRSASDPEWRRYLVLSKPMFIMLNDGGVIDSLEETAIVKSVLLQRLRFFDFITHGLSCALLRGTTFKDSKIITFIFEQRMDPQARKLLPNPFWKYTKRINSELGQLDARHQESLLKVRPSVGSEPPMDGFIAFVKANLCVDLLEVNLALYAFVAHLLVLPKLSVSERSRPYQALYSRLDSFLRHDFLPLAFLAYRTTHGQHPQMDVDGRVLRDLVYFLLTHPKLTRVEALGKEVAVQLEALWLRHKLPVLDLTRLAAKFPPVVVDDNCAADIPMKPLQLLPFKNAVFDDALVDAHIAVPEAEEEPTEGKMDFNTVFQDAQHWHNHRRALLPKHLGGEDKMPRLTDWQKKRQERAEQRFMAKLQWQAESLTGALGKALQRTTIVTAGVNSARVNQQASAAEKLKKKGKIHISSADKIRLQNIANKQSDRDGSNEKWWKDRLEEMKSFSTDRKIAAVERLLGNTRAAAGWLAVEMRLLRLHLELQRWTENPKAGSSDADEQGAIRDRQTVLVMRLVKELCDQGGLFPSARTVLEKVLQCIGFADYASDLLDSSPQPSKDDRKLAFTFIKLLRSKTNEAVFSYMNISEDPTVWQMRLFGEFMDRSMDSQPDSRVSFEPDAWQRQVLDCLDDVDKEGNLNHSILVVAPTSAGKTFVSFYAMEQVLRRSDSEILVYVAPTKALVNQIAAEIYARFSKSYKTGGTSLWAIHTRDYRVHNPQNCQILVTVPEMLAIMLLSPQLSSVWTPRIKRIVLDEIHSIGQQQGGAVWEQIILLAPCPIVGLSATIGEAEKFNSWLESVQNAHGFRHTFIHHPHRYSHLRKFNYVLQNRPSSPFAGLASYVQTNRLRFLHPVSLLSFGAGTLPPDFSMESSDCLALYNTFVSVSLDDTSDLRTLDPTRFFEQRTLLKQKDILRYEHALKEKLVSLIAEADGDESASSLNQITNKLLDPVLANLSAAQQNTDPSVETILSNLIYLISDLNANDDLPAILFSFDRSACEAAAEQILRVLNRAETAWRKSSPEWKNKIQRWEEWKSREAKAVRRQQAERGRGKRKDSDDDSRPDDADLSWESSFSPQDPSPQFTFLGKKCSIAILNEAIEDIRWVFTSGTKWVLNALRRGIGIHHSGMNKHYRAVVESLYRMGYIQVVIATGTLALGINAPTRTSVFFGDSPFLTALMYRQCAGRAGRRGFDLLGKVVFYGLPMDRIRRLVLSKLPSIGGNFPLTSTMVLRLFNLLQGSDYEPATVSAIKNLLKLPQISFISEAGKHEMLHHVRFSIDYLRRSGLLDAQGNPINLFGLAAHLYYTEPNNYALVALMRQGIIHDVCNQESIDQAKRDFLALMCHLFGRRPLPAVYTSKHHTHTLQKKYPSKVVLQEMPVAARRVLQEHDDLILKIFISYAISYLETISQPDESLPLSGRKIGSNDSMSSSSFLVHLRNNHIHAVVRSSFVATSGHGDRFSSVSELAQTCRSGLHLNEHGVPSMRELTLSPSDGKDDVLPLNAYLLDFYTHGQEQALVAANGIRKGDLWYLLEDFTLTLKTICSTVEHLLIKSSASQQHEEIVDGVNFAEVDYEKDDNVDAAALQRPPSVSRRDWRVFEIVNQVTLEFDEKFRAMWA